MLKKSHGPAFKARVIALVQCPACHGKAVTKGVFYEVACAPCSASGWVSAETGESLPLEDLVTQPSLKLQAANRQIESLKKPKADVLGNNRRGPGASNFVGD